MSLDALPLHPALVHFPIVLACLLPCVAGWAFFEHRKNDKSRAHGLVAGVLISLVLTAMVASSAGDGESSRIEHSPQIQANAQLLGRWKEARETHENRADLFVMSAVALSVISVGASLSRASSRRRMLLLAVFIFSFVVMGLGLFVGVAGGNLVYCLDAASLRPEAHSK